MNCKFCEEKAKTRFCISPDPNVAGHEIYSCRIHMPKALQLIHSIHVLIDSERYDKTLDLSMAAEKASEMDIPLTTLLEEMRSILLAMNKYGNCRLYILPMNKKVKEPEEQRVKTPSDYVTSYHAGCSSYDLPILAGNQREYTMGRSGCRDFDLTYFFKAGINCKNIYNCLSGQKTDCNLCAI